MKLFYIGNCTGLSPEKVEKLAGFGKTRLYYTPKNNPLGYKIYSEALIETLFNYEGMSEDDKMVKKDIKNGCASLYINYYKNKKYLIFQESGIEYIFEIINY